MYLMALNVFNTSKLLAEYPVLLQAQADLLTNMLLTRKVRFLVQETSLTTTPHSKEAQHGSMAH
jgi:hypothetical protein